jgi:hypothetical protein
VLDRLDELQAARKAQVAREDPGFRVEWRGTTAAPVAVLRADLLATLTAMEAAALRKLDHAYLVLAETAALGSSNDEADLSPQHTALLTAISDYYAPASVSTAPAATWRVLGPHDSFRGAPGYFKRCGRPPSHTHARGTGA